MIIENKINLGKKTTFGLGGICKNFLIPESIEEVVKALKEHPDAPLLAGGSNIVINDKRCFEYVISLLNFNSEIQHIGNGVYKVGASVRNQHLINMINKDGFGGIENLFSVPGTIGGAIYMNAGTGKELGKFISQNILSVEWFDGEKIVNLSNADCEFTYRHSFFQEHKGLIVNATMKFAPQTIEKSKQLIKERIDRVKKLQDHSGKSCGTLCKVSNRNIMRILKLFEYGENNGIHFSSKTPNWIINSGDGNFEQFSKCISVLRKMHILFRSPLELEIEVWE